MAPESRSEDSAEANADAEADAATDASTESETPTEANNESVAETEAEVLEGYVIDNACVRKKARDDLLEAARTHTAECALMGHCVESGYSLVNEGDGVAMLDAGATPEVVSAVHESDAEEGIRLRVERERRDGEMRTVSVEEVRR